MKTLRITLDIIHPDDEQPAQVFADYLARLVHQHARVTVHDATGEDADEEAALPTCFAL